VFDYEAVEKCVQGTQLVYVCIGTWGNKITQVYSMGTQHIIMAMEDHCVKRIICLSSAGIFGHDGGFFGRFIVPLTLWRPFRDKRKQANVLAASDLEWTLVHATEIKMTKKEGDLKVSNEKMISTSISMRSLINFLVGEQCNQNHIGRMPIIGD
jgi:putative NADH-flavin reductase